MYDESDHVLKFLPVDRAAALILTYLLTWQSIRFLTPRGKKGGMSGYDEKIKRAYKTFIYVHFIGELFGRARTLSRFPKMANFCSLFV